jgi:hypothetical protein
MTKLRCLSPISTVGDLQNAFVAFVFGKEQPVPGTGDRPKASRDAVERPPRVKPFLVVQVEGNRAEQHQAFDDLLPIDVDAHDAHAVVHDAHDEGADDRAGDLADAAEAEAHRRRRPQ